MKNEFEDRPNKRPRTSTSYLNAEDNRASPGVNSQPCSSTSVNRISYAHSLQSPNSSFNSHTWNTAIEAHPQTLNKTEQSANSLHQTVLNSSPPPGGFTPLTQCFGTLVAPLAMNEDEQFARRLQAEFDDQDIHVQNDANLARQLSNDYLPDRHADEKNFDWNAHLYSSRTEYDSLPGHLKYNESYHADKDLQAALEFQRQLDREHSHNDAEVSMQDDQPEPQAGLRGGAIAPLEAPSPPSSDKEILPKIADVNLLNMKVSFNGTTTTLGEIKCYHCTEILFKEPAELTNAIDSWLDTQAAIGCSLACKDCSAKVCVGCWGAEGCDPNRPREDSASQTFLGKAKGKLRSSTKRQSGIPAPTLPDWCCDEAYLSVGWLILIYFDTAYESRQAQAAAAKPSKLPSNQTPRNLGFASDEDHEFYEDFYDADDTMWDGSDDGVPFTVNPNGVSKKQASKSANPSSSENVKPLEHDATADLIMAYRNDLAGLDAESKYLNERQSQLAMKREETDTKDDMDKSHDIIAEELASLTSEIEDLHSRRKAIEDELKSITKYKQEIKDSPSKKHKLSGHAHKPAYVAKTPAKFKKYAEDCVSSHQCYNIKPSHLEEHNARADSYLKSLTGLKRSSVAASPDRFSSGPPLPPIQDRKLPDPFHSRAWAPHTYGSMASTKSQSPAPYNTPPMPYDTSMLSPNASYGPHGPSKLKQSASSSDYYTPLMSIAQLSKHSQHNSKFGTKKSFSASSSPKSKKSPNPQPPPGTYFLSQASALRFSPFSAPGYGTPPSSALSTHPHLKHDSLGEKPHTISNGSFHAASHLHGPPSPAYVHGVSHAQHLDTFSDVFSLFGPSSNHADTAGNAASGPAGTSSQLESHGLKDMPSNSNSYDGTGKPANFTTDWNSYGSMGKPRGQTDHWGFQSTDTSGLDSFGQHILNKSMYQLPPMLEDQPIPPHPTQPSPTQPTPQYHSGFEPHGIMAQILRTPYPSKDPRSNHAAPKGIGYGGHEDMHHFLTRGRKEPKQPSSSKQRAAFEEAIKKRDDLSRKCFVLLTRLISTHHASDSHGASSGKFASLLLSSTCLDVAAEILRNDSLEDAKKRKDLYCAVCELVTVLAKQNGTARLIVQERPYKRGSELIRETNSSQGKGTLEKVMSLQSCMSNLVKQCKVISRNAKTKDARSGFKDMHDICQLILPLSELLCGLKDWTDSAAMNVTTIDSSSTLDHNLWLNYHREHAYEDVPDDVMFADHAFSKRAKESKEAPKGRMKRLIEEGASLSTSLPPGIFVRYAENRPDVMKALIIGPAGTPYHGGMFEFDFWASEKYPSEPPKCTFRTTGNGRAHFNPNLYECGKVCLSLLGTWAGERWRPGESTILQILVSLQAMVLCEEPWFNEPGREYGYGTHRQQSETYNQSIQLLTVRWAMSDVLTKHADAVTDRRKTVWRDAIDRYVKGNKTELKTTVQTWMRKNQGLEHANYAAAFLAKIDQLY